MSIDASQLLNGLVLGSMLMLLTSGLAMIYGLRGIFNFAHGALFMIGAYVTYTVADRSSFWLALLVAPLVLALIGVVLELTVFRWLDGRDHIAVGLLTFGLALMVTPTIVKVYGGRTLSVSTPSVLDGSVPVLGVDYPAYRLFLAGVAIAVSVTLVLWLQRSTMGLYIRAASHDGQSAAILGVNSDRVSLIVVALGSALAGLAGALAAPFQSVNPGMGDSIIVIVLIVMVLGGIGSVGGALAASLLLGFTQTFAVVLTPGFSTLVPYVALVLVLVIKPTGLAGKRLG